MFSAITSQYLLDQLGIANLDVISYFGTHNALLNLKVLLSHGIQIDYKMLASLLYMAMGPQCPMRPYIYIYMKKGM